MVAGVMMDDDGASHLRDSVSGLRGNNGDARQTCCRVVSEKDWGLRFGHCNAATERWHLAAPRLIIPYAHTKKNLTVSDAEELAALIVKGYDSHGN